MHFHGKTVHGKANLGTCGFWWTAAQWYWLRGMHVCTRLVCVPVIVSHGGVGLSSSFGMLAGFMHVVDIGAKTHHLC